MSCRWCHRPHTTVGRTDTLNPTAHIQRGVQVVGYETATGGDTDHAALVVATDGAVSREPLGPGRDMSYTLGERHCAGTIEGDRHDGCPRAEAPYCEQHTSRWACARCRGNCDRPLESCREEHAIYLAAFAPATFKIGVTRSWRLETRLREQGADRAAHLRTVADGRIARQIEADIAATVGDRVRVPAKVRGLHQSVEDDAWESILAEFDPLARYSFEYGLALSDQPMAETLATGTVRGTQGRVLVLDREGGTYAVDMRGLVGYELRVGEPDRNLQSSLAAFE